MSRDVLLLGAGRTPNGRYGGALRDTSVVQPVARPFDAPALADRGTPESR